MLRDSSPAASSKLGQVWWRVGCSDATSPGGGAGAGEGAVDCSMGSKHAYSCPGCLM